MMTEVLSPITIMTIILEVAIILKITLRKTKGFLKSANLFGNI